MAYDDVEMFFHLTPRGWVQAEQENRPDGTVRTVRLHIYQRSAWSREERTTENMWQAPQVSVAELSELESRFPRNWAKIVG